MPIPTKRDFAIFNCDAIWNEKEDEKLPPFFTKNRPNQ